MRSLRKAILQLEMLLKPLKPWSSSQLDRVLRDGVFCQGCGDSLPNCSNMLNSIAIVLLHPGLQIPKLLFCAQKSAPY